MKRERELFCEAFYKHDYTMALPQSAYKDRQFIAVIGDEVCFTYTPFGAHLGGLVLISYLRIP